MKISKSVITILVFPLIAISLVPGCNNQKVSTGSELDKVEQTEAENTITESEKLVEQTPINDAPIKASTVSTVKDTLRLSKAPGVNQTVDLTYTLEIIDPDIKKISSVWIEFEYYDPARYYPLGKGYFQDKMLDRIESPNIQDSPYYHQLLIRQKYQPVATISSKSIIASGETRWDGNTLQEKDQIQLNSQVCFPQAGEWLITVKSKGNDGQPEILESIPLTVFTDYGIEGWTDTFEPATSPSRLIDEPSFCIEATIDKAPVVHQPVKLTYSLLANTVLNNVDVKIEFGLREIGGPKGKQIPSIDVMDKNDISWQGSLQPFSPIEQSVYINFPETGDWEVLLSGTSSGGQYASSTIYLHVGDEEGRFGWVESH